MKLPISICFLGVISHFLSLSLTHLDNSLYILITITKDSDLV